MHRLLLLFVFIAAPSSYWAQPSSPKGSVELDELTFDKIINKFEVSLVKFDVAYPYGDKHEAFLGLANDAIDVDELLIAEVGIKDYGEKDNEKLALKYGATTETFPSVKLFVKGKSEPLTFDDSNGFTTDELRKFIRKNTDLYLSLPGCIKSLDQLAIKFIKAGGDDDRWEIFKELEQQLKNLTPKEATSGNVYKTIMAKILERGVAFLKTENERLQKLLNGKVSAEKKKELGIRTNILQAFHLPPMGEQKEEL